MHMEVPLPGVKNLKLICHVVHSQRLRERETDRQTEGKRERETGTRRKRETDTERQRLI